MKLVRDLVIPVIVALVIFGILQFSVGSFKVYGQSMLPTIKHGEYIMVIKTSYYFHSPQRGEVIVFHSPHDSNSDLIKRIIAIPGDTVEVKGGKVYINNHPLDEDYIRERPYYKLSLQTIPADHYFVLGDNRNNSADSHAGWTAPRENIIGKAQFTYWPPQKWRLLEHYTADIEQQLAGLGAVSLAKQMPCPTK